jgi:hypothetical protein
MKTRRNVSCEGMPFGRAKKLARTNELASRYA